MIGSFLCNKAGWRDHQVACASPTRLSGKKNIFLQTDFSFVEYSQIITYKETILYRKEAEL